MLKNEEQFLNVVTVKSNYQAYEFYPLHCYYYYLIYSDKSITDQNNRMSMTKRLKTVSRTYGGSRCAKCVRLR